MTSGGMRMPTTADLMSMWNASGLKEKLIFTFVMLVLFRFGIHLPVFGINNEIFARIDISDSGPGIPESEQAKIFTRF